MRIPDHVKVGGLIYDISFEDRLLDDENTKVYGIIDYNNLTIKLEKLYSQQKNEQSLWHEIVHAVCVEYNVEMEDEDVDRIGCGLYQVIKDNPALFSDMVQFID